MNFSVCVITKNEEKNIAKCIKSVQPLTCEVVVVDTGSSDNTTSIAKELGAKVFYFKWIDDFSKARNYAISKATGEWIIFLDADEYVTKESINYIPLAIKEANNKQVDFITSLLINYDKANNLVMNSTPTNRIFRRIPDIHYVGAIHEILSRKGHDGYKGKRLDASKYIQIFHTGYSIEDRVEKNKAERNLKLLFSELEEKPNDSNTCFYISESLAMAGRIDEALLYAVKVIENDNVTLLGVKEKNYINIINYMSKLNYSRKEILNIINAAIETNPSYPDFYFYLGNLLKKEERYFDAIDAYNMGLKNLENAFNSQSKTLAQLKDVYHSLGSLLYRTNQLHKSIESYVEVLKIDRYALHSLKELISILNRYESSEDIVKFLSNIYNYKDVKEILTLLHTSLQINSFSLSEQFFNYLTNEQQKFLSKESTYIELLKGQYNSSAEKFKRLYLNTFEHETAIFCLISAELSDKKEVIKELKDYVKPSLRRIIEKMLNENTIELLEEDYYEVLNIIKQYIKIGHTDKIIYLLDFVSEKKLNEIADLLFFYEKYELSLEVYNKYLEHGYTISTENLSNILTRMGECLNELEQYKLSMKFFEDALNLNPNNYRIYEKFILICNKVDDYKRLENITMRASYYFPDSNFIISNVKKVQENE
ncbi:glycosyltransferase [Oceanobacillus salinisoli]|uniref:glycosyltransferase n=1 Tax=Oceanobacillus salinisoli TaxID=2678611 RepID=UPI0012E1F92A|nr:glycosyltransferase [Oceanobacillus salinisoli]